MLTAYRRPGHPVLVNRLSLRIPERPPDVLKLNDESNGGIVLFLEH